MFAGVGMQSNNRKKKTIQASNVTERKWKDREGQGSIVPAMKGRRQNTLRDSSVYLEAKEAFTTYKVAKKKKKLLGASQHSHSRKRSWKDACLLL